MQMNLTNELKNKQKTNKTKNLRLTTIVPIDVKLKVLNKSVGSAILRIHSFVLIFQIVLLDHFILSNRLIAQV